MRNVNIQFTDAKEHIDIVADMIGLCSMMEVISERKNELFADEIAKKLKSFKSLTQKLYTS